MSRDFRLQQLTIGLRSTYAPPHPETNPYEAKLQVQWNTNLMQVALPPETITKILKLIADDVAKAAHIQMDQFVRAALSVNTVAAIEAQAVENIKDDK